MSSQGDVNPSGEVGEITEPSEVESASEGKINAPAGPEPESDQVERAEATRKREDVKESKNVDRLSDSHRKMLSEESGISDDLIEARGYKTVYTKAELKRLGFSENQCSTPSLLIPIHSPAGKIALYQVRPDLPRIDKDGKTVKYETPRESRMVLDVNPLGCEDLDDPSVPLFITEGAKKGDALVSHEACAIALLGVWNFRGTNEKGGKVVLSDWDRIALNGRRVYIVFDSDVMLKTAVYKAMVRLKDFLETRKAEVAVIYLPSDAKRRKQGVDDFLAAGKGLDDLLTHATTELKKPPQDEGWEEIPDKQSARLVRYAAKAELFHTANGRAYITIPMEVKQK